MAQREVTDVGIIDGEDLHGAAVVLWTKPYQRKGDGKWMLYINSERRHSVPISEKVDEARLTEAQRHLIQNWLHILAETETIPFTGNYEAHDGPKNHLAYGIDIYLTENLTVGGQKVPENDVFIVKDGKLFAV